MPIGRGGVPVYRKHGGRGWATGIAQSVENGRLWFMKATQLKGVPGKKV